MSNQINFLRKVLTWVSTIILLAILLIIVYKLWPVQVQEIIHRNILGRRHLGLVIKHRGFFINVMSLSGDCPLDVIGIASGLGLRDFILITDDPYSGERIEIQVKNGKINPGIHKQLVLFNGYACPYINFFTSEGNLRAWLSEHPEIQGTKMSLLEAFEYAKDMFKDEEN